MLSILPLEMSACWFVEAAGRVAGLRHREKVRQRLHELLVDDLKPVVIEPSRLRQLRVLLLVERRREARLDAAKGVEANGCADADKSGDAISALEPEKAKVCFEIRRHWVVFPGRPCA